MMLEPRSRCITAVASLPGPTFRKSYVSAFCTGSFASEFEFFASVRTEGERLLCPGRSFKTFPRMSGVMLCPAPSVGAYFVGWIFPLIHSSPYPHPPPQPPVPVPVRVAPWPHVSISGALKSATWAPPFGYYQSVFVRDSRHVSMAFLLVRLLKPVWVHAGCSCNSGSRCPGSGNFFLKATWQNCR